MVVALIESNVLAPSDGAGNGRYQILLDQSCRVDELERLCFWLAINNIIRISVAIQIKSDIVCKSR
ncbi:MAG: hypothetical protein IKH26_01790 [Bacteroidaceae bacterium]|nr:hypothetical protein [Bacteroidaceae bacterium]